MTFISYAQNCEDVMLFRALRGVEHGFYIDVGAQDPVEDSVTKAFYERGWRGINVEPVEHWYRKLLEDRPHDINLRSAAAAEPGELRLFEVENTGLSTTDETFADRHRKQGLTVHEQRVSCITLESICEKYQVSTVHFLKVDCEGAEESALRGMPLERIRPWIIVIEASEPNSTTPSYQQWEHLLTSRQYDYVYADGINRYYLAAEHRELGGAFTSPPNVLDDFQRAGEYRAHRRVRELHSELVEARSLERSARAEADRDEFQRQALYWREQSAKLTAEASGHQSEIRRLQMEVADFGRMRTGLADEVARLQQEYRIRSSEESRVRTGLADEVARLQQEYKVRSREEARLRAEVAQLRGSSSWRLTAPLRAARRGMGASAHMVRKCVKGALRPLAIGLRPGLRRLAYNAQIRNLALGAMGGRDSAVNRRIRMFLFGRSLRTGTPHVIARVGSELDPKVYSRRERSALDALQRAIPSDHTKE